MLQDGIIFVDSSSAINFQLQSGGTLPATGLNTGELFYLTSGVNPGIYVYNGTGWEPSTVGTVDFSSLNVKQACRAGTTSNITLSGLTALDGVSIVAGNRILVKNQSTSSQNGIYVAAAGAWTRATDFDGSPTEEVESGDFVFVTEGTTLKGTGWVLTTADPITVGTSSLVFAQFTGASTSPGASTGAIQFNDAGVLGGDDEFTFNKTTNVLKLGTSTVPGEFNAHFKADSNFAFRTTEANGTTVMKVKPNGTGTSSSVELHISSANGSSAYGTFLASTGYTSLSSSAGLGLSGTYINISTADQQGYIQMQPFGTAVGNGGATATSATGPFFYIGTMAGTPTGTPLYISQGGLNRAPITIDASNNLMYFYTNGAWRASNAGAVVTPAGSNTQIQYNNGGVLGASGNLTFSSNVLSVGGSLTLGTASTDAAISASNGSPGAGRTFSITGSSAFSGDGGSIYITGGSSSQNNTGGTVYIRGAGANSLGTSVGGSVEISSGSGAPGFGGNVRIVTGTTSAVERLRILANGAWSVGTDGTSYGTSGQVLTSNGNAPPTWTTQSSTATNLSGGSATQIPFQTGAGATSFSSFFTFNTSGNVLSVGGTDGNVSAIGGYSGSWAANTPKLTIRGFQNTNTSGSGFAGVLISGGYGYANAGQVEIRGGESLSPTSGSGGGVLLHGGNAVGTSGLGGAIAITAGSNGSNVSNQGPSVTITGGTATTAAGGYTGGNIVLNAGLAGTAAGKSGDIVINTAISGAGTTYVERFRILSNGAWSVGTGGTAYGTSGQVLTSNGNAAPTWSTPAGGDNLYATGAPTLNSGTNNISIGVISSAPSLVMSRVGTADNRAHYISTESGGAIYWRFLNDAFSASSPWLTVARSGNTASNISLIGTALTLNINGSVGTNGQVLTSNGTSASWQTPSAGAAAAGTLTGTTLAANVVSSSLTSVGSLGSLTVTGAATVNGAATFGAAVTEKSITLGANDIDVSLANSFVKIVSGASTLTVSNVPASGKLASFVLSVVNGGSAAVTWWSGVKWPGGVAPALTASGLDVLGFFTIDGGTTWIGSIVTIGAI